MAKVKPLFESTDKEEVVISFLPNKIVRLVYTELDSDIDMDELTTIDYSNLTGELLTISTLLNRVGLLKAEIEKEVMLAKLDCDIFESEERRQARKVALSEGVKATYLNDHLKDALRTSASLNAKKRMIINQEHVYRTIESLFWSVKSKDEKLKNLTKNLTPEDMEREIVEGVVNGMMIVARQKAF